MVIDIKKLNANRRLVPYLWELTVLLYLLRSIAEPLKYLFILSFGLLVISYSFYFILNFRKNAILKFLVATKEFHILGLFLIAGIILSGQIQILSVKSLANYLGISFLYLVYFEYEKGIHVTRLFRGWMFFTMAIGILGLLKWLNFILGLEFGFFSQFYQRGTSLVSEYNFYAGYFIVSLLVYFYALYTNAIQKKLIINQAILLTLIFIITMTGSRRGIIVLAAFAILAQVLLLFKRRNKGEQFYRNLFSLNILLFCLLLLIASLIPFRSKIVHKESSRKNIASTLFRINTLFYPNSTYFIFYDKLWPKTSAYHSDTTEWEKYATFNNLNGDAANKYHDLKSDYWIEFENKNNSKNLLYNGDLTFGSKFWRIYAKANIEHEIISTEYGNAIRVSRTAGSGNWPLEYRGREIVYHKGVNYTYRFKYRLIKGKGVPFKIGWWVDEGAGPKNDLDYRIKSLGKGWFEYTASYRFKNDQRNLLTFMNTQHKNTIIDFTDIELESDDTLNRPNYLDQILDIEGRNLFYNSNFSHGLKFWGSVTLDSVSHRIVDSPYGKAIRIKRNEGQGMWPLAYEGRDIYYYKDVNYYFRFKFRVIEGIKIPFKIGWRALDVKPIPYNLHKDIFPIGDEWFECITSYQFNKDHYDEKITFLNNQEANTIIDLTDIELLCKDTLNRSMYADEMVKEINYYEQLRLNRQLESEDQKLLSKRVERWKYAMELWKEYPWYNKLLGGGFDYLKKFGQKFYPEMNKIDYPHNPIISSFLYSGLIGGLFYIYFLSLSIWYYWKYRKRLLLFLMVFTIFFIFMLISGDNHFGAPIFAMLSLVPYLTKYFVSEKEIKNQN